MGDKDFSSEELRAALAAADKHVRLPYIEIVLLVAIAAFATSFGFRAADFSNPTHVLVVAAFVTTWAWMFLGGFLLQSRQLAANARMLRALELMDERMSVRGGNG